MSEVLKGGNVRRQDEEDKLAVAVVSVAFDGLGPRDKPAPGCDGVLILASAPESPYQFGDALVYQGSNGGGGDLNFEVVQANGATNCNVQVV